MSPLNTVRAHLQRSRNFGGDSLTGTVLDACTASRIEALGLIDQEHYVDYLEASPNEYGTLLDCVQTKLPKTLVGGKQADIAAKLVASRVTPKQQAAAPFRIWSIGCATGLEPFTLAIAIAETLGLPWLKQKVKIFATDSDEARLAAARQFTFSAEELSGLPANIQSRYFQPSGSGFSFKYELRRSIIFGKHEILKDPIISRINLLISQNFLLYHHAEEQTQILTRLGTAFAENGLLVLGDLEKLPEPEHNLFSIVDAADKVLAMRSGVARMPLISDESSRAEDSLWAAGFDAMPVAQIIIDERNCLAEANSRARSTFGLLPHDLGKPLQDLEISYRPLELRSVIEKAGATNETVLVNRVQRFAGTGKMQMIDVFVSPLMSAHNLHAGYSVQFHDVTDLCLLQDEMAGLNEQLQTANEELQAAHEELETTNEELQSTNEELQTTNEELQSANEELETMNEELHSSNAELEVTNSEQSELTVSADQTSSFLESILGSLHAAMMVLNDEAQVVVWSQRCTELWGLRKAEVAGVRLADLDIGLPADAVNAAIASFKDDRLPESTITLPALDKTGRPLVCGVRISSMTLESEQVTLLLIEARQAG